MKKIIVYLIVLSLFTTCSTKLSNEQSSQLKKFYTEKNYFKLDNLMSKIKISKSNPDLLLYRATLDNVFNKPETSTGLINTLLEKYPEYFNDSIIKDLYVMRSENAFRMQDYRSAYYDDSTIVSKYGQVCDSTDLDSRKDDISILRIIANVTKMTISRPSDSRVSIRRDLAGLFNVPVVVNKDTVDFVFDTGANVSVIIESLARKYGVKILGGKAKTGTSTGKKVEGEIGILDLKLGTMEVKNSIFLVLPDSTLTFANGAYIIKGVIGFPIMYAFQEFITKDDKFLIVPQKHDETNNRNLAFDGANPLIMVTYKNDTLPFLFDSGNTKTGLNSIFFHTYKNEIVGKCKKQKETTGGAGGSAESEAYILDSINISAGNSECKLYSLRIFPNDLMGYDAKYQYGNFGQDYINKFSEMTINFACMNISFSNKKK
jgi:hypothetical protein